jgi:hypothetical protein
MELLVSDSPGSWLYAEDVPQFTRSWLQVSLTHDFIVA